MVTGLDLVELQINIAAGKKIPFSQEDVAMNGWAMEARICSENPSKGFMPSTGMITRYAEPKWKNVRVDSGIQVGSVISVFYDSMLAKVICKGKDRETTREALVEALNGYHIEGVVTNIDFVNAVLNEPDFITAQLSTHFIETHFQGGRSKKGSNTEHLFLAALAATMVFHVRTAAVRDSLIPMTSQIGRDTAPKSDHSYKVRSENDIFDIGLTGSLSSRNWTGYVNDRHYMIETPEFEFYRRRLRLNINGATHRFRMQAAHPFIIGAFCGISRTFEIYTPREWELIHHIPKQADRAMDDTLVCPMPGLVVEIMVKQGDRVYRGQDLLIIESMKMESGVASPCDGRVSEILVSQGQSVDNGDLLIRFTTQN